MLDFSINNIFGQFGGRSVIPMGTTYAPMLTDLFYNIMRQTSFKGFSVLMKEN
jgi:hypothetical protein